MITQLRIDERLLHGQVTTQWSKFLAVTGIVVANDYAAENEMLKKMLKMAAPVGIKVTIRTIDDAISLLNDPRGENMRMLVIVDNPKDALALVNALPIEIVNVANFTKKQSDHKIQLTHHCSADPDDLKYFAELAKCNIELISQMIPGVEKENFKEIIKKIKKED
ncbi:PTS system mannose/fructose/N-acetylgalactosamine-transporter subunit IIB [Dielma fastidiosa]|uniref:PTS sugar transporter subunit IIB n=1 Tax=Dielma fastidiosa TaxID=1034346 RepID=A0A318LBK5_9FIRM|nr:PTS sugar transporter subunit IIB [Dielma fastidiosa]MDY5167686.1 PTS sugar transporter subunit IIB [Dielma fastidiosa]PXX79077.1 PTS system mannose-specific IIB component [Dielma fastidiosa]